MKSIHNVLRRVFYSFIHVLNNWNLYLGTGKYRIAKIRSAAQGNGPKFGENPKEPTRWPSNPRYRPQRVQRVRLFYLFTHVRILKFIFSCSLIIDNIVLLSRALRHQFIIPDFETFTSYIDQFYEKVKQMDSGKVATYIPQLAKQDPTKFGISICTIDGQRYSLGDATDSFTLQSCWWVLVFYLLRHLLFLFVIILFLFLLFLLNESFGPMEAMNYSRYRLIRPPGPATFGLIKRLVLLSGRGGVLLTDVSVLIKSLRAITQAMHHLTSEITWGHLEDADLESQLLNHKN